MEHNNLQKTVAQFRPQFIYLSIYGSIILMELVRFFSYLIYTESVVLLGRGISPCQGRYLRTE
jgi:hypothetical protein